MFHSSTHDNKLQKQQPQAGYDNAPQAGYGGAPHSVPHDPRLANDPLAPGAGGGGMGGQHHQQPMGAGAGAGMHTGMQQHPHDAGMQQQQYGTNTGTGTAGIPPTGALSSQHQQPHSGGGGGGAMTGKIEHAIGTIVGSKSLKAKGMQKEEEAKGLKVQSQELAEAERLEREAGLRRERAVAHGAHPDNRHVGGVVPGGGGPGAYN